MFSRRTTRSIGVLLAASLLAAPPVRLAQAHAPPGPKSSVSPEDPDRVEAQRLFDRGSEAYNLGRFAAAIESFERAYELTQVTALLYNIAQAHTKYFEVDADPAHLRRAKVMFLNFAKIAEATGEDPRDARKRVQQIDQQLAELAAQQTEARAHAAQVEANRIAAQRVENERIAAEARRLEAEARAEVERRYRPRPLGVAGYALLGAGLVGGITMIAIGGASTQRLQTQRAEEMVLPLPASRLALYDERLAQARALGLAGLGVGLGLLVAGVTMVSVDAVRRRKAPRRATLGPGGLMLSF